MADNIYNELFKVPSEKFQKHVESDINERILFSGKFGKGKTTFLKHFFENKQSEFFTIHLSPVNYSIASNEDIFKYIKYDIILEFLKQGVEFEESDFNFMDTLPLFIKQHPAKIVSKLLSFIPFVGKEIDELYKKGEELYEDIKKHTGEINDSSEGNQLEKYLEKIESSEVSIYENDFITKIIGKAVDRKHKEGKKVVLIIDDLDRLDPEHIFRILNVFASQFDNYNNNGKSNKFGLTKIINVCDLENIRNIYKNRYGANVDFLGYINKFYSVEPFSFSNYNDLKEISFKILNKINVNSPHNKAISFGAYINNLHNNSKCSIGVYQIIANLLFFDFISLRTLLINCEGRSFAMYGRSEIDENVFENDDFSVVIEVQIINYLLGDFENTMHVLTKLENISTVVDGYKHFYNMLFYFMIYNSRGYPTSTDGFNQSFFDGSTFRYKISFGRVENLQTYTNGMWIDFHPTKKDYFKALKLLVTRLYENGIIE